MRLPQGQPSIFRDKAGQAAAQGRAACSKRSSRSSLRAMRRRRSASSAAATASRPCATAARQGRSISAADSKSGWRAAISRISRALRECRKNKGESWRILRQQKGRPQAPFREVLRSRLRAAPAADHVATKSQTAHGQKRVSGRLGDENNVLIASGGYCSGS